MAIAKVKTIALVGLVGHIIEIEVDITDGLPSYTLLGLPDTALNESRDRVRSAMVNSGFMWPNKRVTVSLSPAWLPKKGSTFDLPIAIALMVAMGEIPQELVDGILFIGEVGLDGIVQDHHTCDAVALEDAEVCVMPFDRIEELSREVTALQHHVHKIMSREIVREHVYVAPYHEEDIPALVRLIGAERVLFLGGKNPVCHDADTGNPLWTMTENLVGHSGSAALIQGDILVAQGFV